MASRTVWHFAYGSNMNRAQMLSRVGNIVEEHNAHLPNFELRFNKKVRGGTAGANVQPAPGKTVYGVLYKIEENAFRSLDRYEGVPEHYRRIEIQVTPDGGTAGSGASLHCVEGRKGFAPVRALFAGDPRWSGRAQFARGLHRRDQVRCRRGLIAATPLVVKSFQTMFTDWEEGPWPQRRYRERHPAEAVF